MDTAGLQNIYLTLSQMDEAVGMHLEDAEKHDEAHGTGIEEALETVRSKIKGTQSTLGRVLKVLGKEG